MDLVKLETGKIKSYGSTAASSDETAGLLTPPSGASSPHLVRSRKFEVVELCSMFLGDKGSSTYIFTLGLYMYGTLWAYTSVFANACSYALPLSKMFGVGVDDYLVYVAVFASVVVPLTCMELKEQVRRRERDRGFFRQDRNLTPTCLMRPGCRSSFPVAV